MPPLLQRAFIPLSIFSSCHCDSFTVSAAKTQLPFVKNISRVALRSSQCFGSYRSIQSGHIGRLGRSALIARPSPNEDEFKGSFHANYFFRMIIHAINCKGAPGVCREIPPPNEIKHQFISDWKTVHPREQNTNWCLDKKTAKKFESIFPSRHADA